MRVRLVLFVMLLSWSAYAAQTQNASGYAAKWDMIQQFVELVGYPNEGERKDQPFVIGILGENPFKEESATAQKNGLILKGRKVQFQMLSGVSAIRDIDVLFIARDYEAKTYYAVRAAQKAPILTIGDTRTMSTQGVMITFIADNNEVQFHLNHQLMAERGFNPDIKLLRMTQ